LHVIGIQKRKEEHPNLHYLWIPSPCGNVSACGLLLLLGLLLSCQPVQRLASFAQNLLIVLQGCLKTELFTKSFLLKDKFYNIIFLFFNIKIKNICPSHIHHALNPFHFRARHQISQSGQIQGLSHQGGDIPFSEVHPTGLGQAQPLIS